MKRYLCIICIVIVNINTINAHDFNFGWSVGDAGLSSNMLKQTSRIGSFDLISSFNLLNLNLIINEKIGINTSLFSTRFQNNDIVNMYYTFLPVEIAFIPFQYNDFLYFSLYARGAWQLELPSNLFWTNMFSPENNRFYGAIGTRLFFSSSTINKLHYSMYSSLFFEYTTLNELTIGITLDAVILGAVVVVGAAIGILKGKYDNIEKERTNQPNYIP